MRELYDTSGPGKFEGCPPIARYCYEEVLGVSGEDEQTTHPSEGVTEGTARIGRRLVSWDDVGFVYYERCDTEQAAIEKFAEQAAVYDALEDEEVPQ